MGNILILVGSGRREGNTELLARELARGAEGAQVEILPLAGLRVAPCLGCDTCVQRPDHSCVQKDDMQMICDKLAWADGVVMASPLYFAGISAQLKAVLDRLHSPIKDSFHFKKIALLMTAGSPKPASFASVSLQYETLVRHFKLESVGTLLVNGMHGKGDVENHPEELERARTLGRAMSQAI